MSVFDLLFLVLAFTALLTLLAAASFAFHHQFARARRALAIVFLAGATYMAVVIVVSLLLPRRVLQSDATECFDDWCIAVAGCKKDVRRDHIGYHVGFRLSSRARRVSQRENNISVYLTDNRGRRYYPSSEPQAAPAFNVLLGPGESAVVQRNFAIPATGQDVGLVITHEGGFPIGWFIIGYDTWFRKPALINLPEP